MITTNVARCCHQVSKLLSGVNWLKFTIEYEHSRLNRLQLPSIPQADSLILLYKTRTSQLFLTVLMSWVRFFLPRCIDAKLIWLITPPLSPSTNPLPDYDVSVTVNSFNSWLSLLYRSAVLPSLFACGIWIHLRYNYAVIRSWTRL